jgi:hypothetical protein
MNYCVIFGKILKKYIVGAVNLTMTEANTGIGILISIIVIIAWSFYALISKKRKSLLEKRTLQYIGKLYFEVNVKSKFGLFYF